MARDDTTTALIVEVAAAEPVVAGHRLELDANARLGSPAHVTILAPFMPASEIGPDEQARLRRVFSGVRPFDFRLDRVAWFGTTVVWLGPEDPGPFRDLTSAVFGEFPDFPPFEGRFDDVVPHLTIGCDGPLDTMRRAEQQITPQLPIAGRVAAVTLMGESWPTGQWLALARFPLG